jgi:hypothetical protein
MVLFAMVILLSCKIPMKGKVRLKCICIVNQLFEICKIGNSMDDAEIILT